MRSILLVEPGYRNKYPPLGLMKISSYHKLVGDDVHFVKGCKAEFRERKWDRIYVSTLFTFHWPMTMKTIKYYQKAVNHPTDVYVGGVMATLLADEITSETNTTVIKGLLDTPGVLDPHSSQIVDSLIPDYEILDSIDYVYPVRDAYIAYATRGCPNHCDFCAVNKLEPEYIDYVPLKKQVKAIERVYGQKQNLLLLDNNVLASKDFELIVRDIKTLGFERNAKLNNRLRFVDFNQGLDARLLTENKVKLLSEIALRPARIAFDHIEMKTLYTEKIRLAVSYGILNLSNYILYNYKDSPEHLYERLSINCKLNCELGSKIYSFPMKYIPLYAKDRRYIGKHWNRKLIRGVQCILLATRGMVSPKLGFFIAAFGESEEEFLEIANMPDEYIINRRKYSENRAIDWKRLYRALTANQKAELFEIHMNSHVTEVHRDAATSMRLKNLLNHYIEADRLERERRDIAKKD